MTGTEQPSLPSDIANPTKRVEAAMDRLCQLVTENGPTHLVRGMPSYLAHEAMLACIENLVEVLTIADTALEELHNVAEWCAMKHYEGHPSAGPIQEELRGKGKILRDALAIIAARTSIRKGAE